MSRYVIGIDVGTTAIKMLALDDQHQVVYQTSATHTLYSERSGWAEEDADIWWAHTLTLLGQVAAQLTAHDGGGGKPPQIAAIGVSGMVPAIVLVGADGRPLRRSIQQNDARCVEQIRQIKGSTDQSLLFARTGGYTNQQHVLPRLLWVRSHEPEVWNRIERVCGSYDWIVHHLTGEWSVEENWAVESGLFDIHERKWIERYFTDAAVPLHWFPEVRRPMDVVGHVREDIARQVGLCSDIPVIAGSADHVASALSAGVIDEGDLLIKFGGAGDILFCTNELVTHEQLFFDYHDIDGKYLLNGCMASSGSLVRWFVDQFVPHNEDANVYADLDAQAQHIGPGTDGLVVLPYLLGEKTPIFDPQARGVFFGLSLHHTPAHVFHAILESVIYGFRHHLDVLAEKGLYPQRIFATNGGAKSRLWLQIAADVIGQPLTSFRDHPGSSLGVAFMAGKAVGLYRSWDEVHDCLPPSATYTPNAAATSMYDVTYGVYRRLYESLQADFHLISETFAPLP